MRLTHRKPRWIPFDPHLPGYRHLRGPFRPIRRTPDRQSVTRLPMGAQAAISGTLGRADLSYHAARVSAGFRASSEKNGLRLDFGREGVSVASGPDRVNFALRAIGYGDRLRKVAGVAPIARDNRVEYRRRDLIEWYVNGPLGLEQGFTLKAPPERGEGPLTLAVSLSSSLSTSLGEGGRELVLSRGGGFRRSGIGG